jgi:hypothetical protein
MTARPAIQVIGLRKRYGATLAGDDTEQQFVATGPGGQHVDCKQGESRCHALPGPPVRRPEHDGEPPRLEERRVEQRHREPRTRGARPRAHCASPERTSTSCRSPR